jgi:hypothetical protein
MDAADLAKEVCTYNKLRDRPSRAALVLCHTNFATDEILMITSPIESGRQLFRLVGKDKIAKIDYDPNNSECVAACVDACMTNGYDLRLISLSDTGVPEGQYLAVWKYTYFFKEPDLHSRLQQIQVVLKTLLTADMPQ